MEESEAEGAFYVMLEEELVEMVGDEAFSIYNIEPLDRIYNRWKGIIGGRIVRI